MNVVAPIKQVPGLVEELEIDGSSKDLNREWLKHKINEFDDHALEEALSYKEANGGTITVIALDSAQSQPIIFFGRFLTDTAMYFSHIVVCPPRKSKM